MRMRHSRSCSSRALQSHEFLMGKPLFAHSLVFVGDRVPPRKPATYLDEAAGDEALDVRNRASLIESAHEPEERRLRHV